jgi:hypothetical protein
MSSISPVFLDSIACIILLISILIYISVSMFDYLSIDKSL